MSILTINAFPTTATINASYNEETITAIGSVAIEVDNGTVVSYEVVAEQCTTKTGTETVTADKTLEVILNYIGAVSVDTWVPSTGKASFPTHIAMLGKGGWREVSSIAERDAIPSARREVGMAVFVTSEAKLYILNEDLTTWDEFKSGSTDSVRKTDNLDTFEPLFDGEIVQYVGATNQNYTHGYFYKQHKHVSYTNIQFTPKGDYEIEVSISDEDLTHFLNDVIMYCEEPYVQGEFNYRQTNPEVQWSFSPETASHTFRSYSNTPEGYAELGFIVTPPIGEQQGLTFTVEPVITYTWEQIDVQPSTPLIWGNITGTLSDQTDLNTELTNLQDQIDVLKSRGRYLSTWNTQTGLPETNPEELPYPLRAGDYYLVSNAVKAMPETILCGQLVGTGLSDITVNELQWKTTVNPQSDLTQDFSYTNIEISQTQSASGDDSSLTVLNQTLLDQKFDEIEQLAIDWCETNHKTFVSLESISVEWYMESDTGKVLVRGHCECAETPGQDNAFEVERIVGTSLINSEEELKEALLYNYGLKVNGTMQFPVPWMSHSTFLNIQGPSGRWTYLGQPVADNDLNTAYGITYSGTPVIGDVIELRYLTEKVNYKPIVEIVTIEGVPTKCYNGTASTTIEPLEVSINDSYVFDGNVWILLSNAQKEVSFATLSGSPYDNAALTEALNNKSQVVFKRIIEEEEPEEEPVEE